MSTKHKQFLSCDWGTSSFRMRLVDVAMLKVVDEIKSGQGIALTHSQWLASGQSIDRHKFYKRVITDAVHRISKASEQLTIILSGMASSTIGIHELPYNNFPFSWKVSDLLIHNLKEDEDLGCPLYLVSGMRTATDIMRGEETMLLGCDQTKGDAVYIFPGTHSKHVIVKKSIAIDFKTYITGELFSIMTKNSILKNSVDAGEDSPSFESGVRDAQSSNLLHSLFTVRSRQVLSNTSPISNYQYLSGLIIGTELKELKESSHIHIVGEELSISLYRKALNLLGIKDVYSSNATNALLQGHKKIFNIIDAF